MQEKQTNQSKPVNKLNVSELFRTFESEAKNETSTEKLVYFPEKREAPCEPELERQADKINVLIQRYRYHKKQQLLAGEAKKRKEAGQCKRIQSEAITIMIRAGFYRKSQLRGLEIAPETILTEIRYREKLIEWITTEFREGSPVWSHLLYIAGWGESIDYSHLTELDKKLTGLRNETEAIAERISLIRKPQPEREKYDKDGQEIEHKPRPGWMPPTREEFNEGMNEIGQLYDRIKEVQTEYDRELHRTSNLKKIPENFCYQLFQSIELPKSPEAITVEWVPDEIIGGSYPVYYWEQNASLEATPGDVRYRINRMSRYYLEKLASMICSYYNELNAMDIEETRREQDTKRKADMYTHKRKYTTEEMRELIQIGIDEGMTQKEIALQLGCTDRTIRNYSK